MKAKLMALFCVFCILYASAYGWYRQTHIEVWEGDGKYYVIFPENELFFYYFFRPLSYVDGLVSGMAFHIGPHQPQE